MHFCFLITRLFPALLAAAMLSACAGGGSQTVSEDGIYDPYEPGNRKVHRFNRGLDRALVRPAAIGYSTILPDEVEDSIGNFASNLGEPSIVVNSLLQGDLRGAGNSTLRFLTNSTLGLFGFFDVANEFKMAQHETDFGETLHVWGVREGAYLELPVLGPSTTRDTVGLVVDLFTNPLSYTVDEPEAYYGTVASVAASLSTRGRLTDTIDSVLYESADSYAQARLIYLQNRRFELGQEDPGAEIDPFALDTEGF